LGYWRLMKTDYNNKIKDHTATLEKIYKQRRIWLYSSSLVYTCSIVVIFSWDYLVTYAPNKIWWVMIAIGVILSINWWYWTMKSIAEVVRGIYSEYEILTEITSDIEDIRTLLKENIDYTNNQKDRFTNNKK